MERSEQTGSTDNAQARPRERKGRFYKNWKLLVIVAYAAFLLFFLLGEMGLHRMRATNQIILLVVLLFVPFLLSIAPNVVETLKIMTPGGQGLELRLKELQHGMEVRLDDVHARLKRVSLDGRITTAEQALLPMLGGPDPRADARLDEGTLIIGSKEWPEQWIMGELLAQRIAQVYPGVKCVRKFSNGGTLKNFADLTHAWIDGYVEYTGTGCLLMSVDHHGKDASRILDELRDRSAARGLSWLSPLGPRPDYVMVMREDRAGELGIADLQDLAVKGRQLRLCGYLEFLSRPDAFPGLVRAYRLSFRDVQISGFDEQYDFLREDQADVCVGHATDEQLRDGWGFRVLRDPKEFFPHYEAVPLFRTAVLDRYPKLRTAFDELKPISNERIGAIVSAVKKIYAEESVPHLACGGHVVDLLDEIR